MATGGALIAAALDVGFARVPGTADAGFFLWLAVVAVGATGLAVMALRDIRRLRREAESALAARDRWSRAFDAAPLGLAVFDPDGRLDRCNDFYRSVEPDGDIRSILGLHESGARSAVASEHRLADGRWISVRRIDLADGGYIVLAVEITRNKEREADWRAQADGLRLSLSASGDWIWETDILHRVANVTPLSTDIDPADVDWMVGHHLADLASASGGIALDLCLRTMNAHQRLENTIVQFHDGVRLRDARLSGVPALDDSGRFLGYRGVGAFVAAAAGIRASIPADRRALAAAPEAPGQPAAGRGGDGGSGRPRLLVAEDSQTNRLLAAAILGRMGYEADLVENGRQAVEAVWALDYGAVLMDVWMPELGGLEATAEIRALPAPKSEIPIIAMTAHVDAEDRQRCLDAGMDEHLEKPIDRGRLAAVLRELVGEPGEPAPGTPAPAADADSDGAAALPLPPPAPNAPAAEEIDDSVIEQLKADAGPEIVAELIGTYMGETDERLTRMTSAIGEGRLEDIAGDAHAMKSSSGTFGAIQLQMLAARIEAAATGRERDEVESLLAGLPTLVSKTRDGFASRGFPVDGAG